MIFRPLWHFEFMNFYNNILKIFNFNKPNYTIDFINNEYIHTPIYNIKYIIQYFPDNISITITTFQ